MSGTPRTARTAPQFARGNGGRDVERINQFDLYGVARQLTPFLGLNAHNEDLSTTTVFWPMWQARDALQSLLNGEPCALGISKMKCRAALEAVKSIQDQHFRKEATGASGSTFKFPEEGDEPVQGWLLRQAQEEIGKFETVFAEELREEATYRVPSRGIYSTPKLIDSADESFPTGLGANISLKARDEWRASGRCLAFNLLSASGFHVARAVELVMQDYFQHFTGKDPSKLKTWHEYLTELDGMASEDPAEASKPSKKTVTELKQMKDDYRNPIMHPRIVLNEADARMLFANGEAAIIAMAMEMKLRAGYTPATAKKTGAPTTLATSATIKP